MNRRRFVQSVPLMAGTAVLLEGCPTGAVDTVLNLLNLLAPGIDGILPLVGLADPILIPVLQGAVAAFDATLATVTAAWKNYETALAANGGNTPSLLQMFKSALSSLNTNIQQVLAAAHVKDPATATVIGEIVAAVSTEIGQIVSIFTPPLATHATARTNATVAVMPTDTQITAEELAFKNRMRAILSRQTGDVQLDAQTATIAKAFN